MRAARTARPARRGDAGQALLLVALLLSVLCAVAALAIDGGLAMLRQREAQNAADAAALAGAADLPGNPAAARAAAAAYAAQNGFTDGTGGVTVSIATPPTASAQDNGDPAAIEVVVRAPVPTGFARVLGSPGITVGAAAVAARAAGAPCALCILSPTAAGALGGNGNGTTTVSGANVAVDSAAPEAAALDGNAAIAAAGIGIVGGYAATENASFSPTPATGILPVPDPLAAVPAPALTGSSLGAVSASGNQSLTSAPGIYTSLAVQDNGALTLEPGLYVITGQVSVTGNGSLQGQGVTLYFTCSGYTAADPAPCRGHGGGSLLLGGNGTFDLTAPTGGTYQGLTVFYDRGNTAALAVSGNAADVLQGTVYAKSAAAALSGNGTSAQLDSLIIANTVTLNGNGNITIDYSAAQNYPVRQIPRLSP